MTDAVRRAIWIELSYLFLDNDIGVHLTRVEQSCRASGYDVATLDAILRDEVAPVCLANLMGPPGEWIGFDEAWLVAQIEAVRRRRPILARVRRAWRARQIAWLVPEWGEIKARLDAPDPRAP